MTKLYSHGEMTMFKSYVYIRGLKPCGWHVSCKGVVWLMMLFGNFPIIKIHIF